MNKKITLTFLLIFLVVFQIVAVSALSASQAKENWEEAKQLTAEKRLTHNEAKEKWNGNKSDENVQGYVATGKDLLNSALDEAEAWLIWKQEEVEDEEDISAELRNKINEDIESNLAKIEELRGRVDGVTIISGMSESSLNFVAIGMVGDYLQLLTDVARSSGQIWVEKSNQYISKIEEYEQLLRQEAENRGSEEEVIAKLDSAKNSISEARDFVNKAELVYTQVVEGGSPLIKFNEGNQNLRNARLSMINANTNLRLAFRLMAQD